MEPRRGLWARLFLSILKMGEVGLMVKVLNWERVQILPWSQKPRGKVMHEKLGDLRSRPSSVLEAHWLIFGAGPPSQPKSQSGVVGEGVD